MTFTDRHDYDESRAGDEQDQFRPLTMPVAIHLSDRSGAERYVITGTTGDRGGLRIIMRVNGHGTSYALSNLQSQRTCPTICRPGWQDDLIHFARGGLYTVNKIDWGVTP